MKVNYREIEDAFNYVSGGSPYDNQAYLDSETGKIYWHSEFGDNFEELPDDVDDEKYIEIPHKSDLDLGRSLIFDFIDEYLPDELGQVEFFFRNKGAYAKFKGLLERKDQLENWYEFEALAQEKALREWCDENDIELQE